MQTTVFGVPVSPAVVWWQRLATALGLVATVGLWLLASLPRDRGVVDLSGTWRVEGAPGIEAITLPGLFAYHGLAPDARVSAHRAVVVTSRNDALLLERPMYAVTVRWDGVVVGGAGDPASDDPGQRSQRTLVVPLPSAAPGSLHELELDVRGDFGKGGFTGAIAMGPASEVFATASAIERQRLSVVLGLSLLGAVPLLVAIRFPRPASVAYGSFVIAAAAASLGQTNLALDWLPDPVGAMKSYLSLGAVVAGLGVLYVDSFREGRPGVAASWFAGGCGALAVGALLAPTDWLWWSEVCTNALHAVFGAWFAARVYQAWRDRVPGSWVLVIALVVALWAIVTEVSMTQGLRTGGSWLGPAALAFALALGAALALRDAAVSAQHEQLVRSSLDAMVTVDARGRIDHANPAAVKLLGVVSRGAPTGTSLLVVVAEGQRPLVRAHVGRATTRPDRCEFQTGSARSLESLGTPLGSGLVMLTLRDITVRREMDRAVLQAARLETAGVLMGGIAHDFNNMLGSVLAHVGLLRMQVPDPRVHARLDKMEATVEKASELTRRLITVARGTGAELALVDLGRVCRVAADLAEPTLPAGVTLTLDVPATLPPVLGATGDLEQVLVNLLVNARDAVGATGSIRLRARTFQHNGRPGGVVVVVEDDGPGVPIDRRTSIFEPFVTDKAHGTGLGLAVARQILRDHHGRIWIEDAAPHGARFFVALRHADAVDEAPAALPSQRRVLVVDDEPVLLETHVSALRNAGYEVTGVASSTEALSWLESHGLDLLVTDVRMPNIHGLELARLCRAQHPLAPILFVTGFVPEEGLETFEPGTWAALHKPIRLARLVATAGHLRRRAERVAEGREDVTAVSYAFPQLDQLTGESLGF
jgi:PAS domain S-box-containing protein